MMRELQGLISTERDHSEALNMEVSISHSRLAPCTLSR